MIIDSFVCYNKIVQLRDTGGIRFECTFEDGRKASYALGSRDIEELYTACVRRRIKENEEQQAFIDYLAKGMDMDLARKNYEESKGQG